MLEKLRHYISRHSRAIAGRGAKVVNGTDLRGCGCSGQLDQRRIDSFSLYDSFRFSQTERNGRDTPHRQTNILDNAIRHMTTAHTPTGGYAWVESLHDAVEDIVFGFYDITHGAIKAGATIDLYAVAL